MEASSKYFQLSSSSVYRNCIQQIKNQASLYLYYEHSYHYSFIATFISFNNRNIFMFKTIICGKESIPVIVCFPKADIEVRKGE